MTNQDILSIDEIVEALKDKRLYVIARRTGLSYPTVKKLADGKKENYTLDTLKRISNYINHSH